MLVIAVDIDGTITKESCWNREQVLKATPNRKLIEMINDLYCKGYAIILYTCRGDSVIPATRCWLKENHVKYHALNNNKLWADIYLDDKGISPDNFVKYGTKIINLAEKKRSRDRAPKNK